MTNKIKYTVDETNDKVTSNDYKQMLSIVKEMVNK